MKSSYYYPLHLIIDSKLIGPNWRNHRK